MATNNFTAASGEWNTAGNWSLGHVPTSSEDTTFTGLDGSGALTITTTAAAAKSVDFSGAGAAFTLSGSVAFEVSGSLTCKSGMTWSHSGILRVANYANGTLTTNSVNLGSITFLTGRGATLTLGDNCNIGTKAFYIYSNSGALVTNNYQIDCGVFGDASQAGAVTLTLGSSTINCTNVFFAAATLTVTANTAAINITSTDDITSHFGGSTWGGTVTVLMTGGKVMTLNGANTFDKFAISWTSASFASALKFGANQVFSNATSDALKITGSSVITRPIIQSSSVGTQRTITAATTNITGAMDFEDISGAGAGDWDLSAIPSGNCGGNTGITFRTPANYYATTLTANREFTDNIWSTADDGTADGTGVFPVIQDTAVLNNNTGDNSGKTLTSNVKNLCAIDASALTENLVLSFSVFTVCYGPLNLASNSLSISGAIQINFNARLQYELSTTLDLTIWPSFGSKNVYIGGYGTQIGTV